MIKKIIISLISSVFILSAASCESPPPPSLSIGSEQDCTLYCNDKIFVCHIQQLGDELCSVTLTKPKELSGLCYRYSDGEYNFCYNGLCSRNESQLLPQNSLLYMTLKALRSLQSNPPALTAGSEGYTADTGTFTVYTDNEGRLTSLSF